MRRTRLRAHSLLVLLGSLFVASGLSLASPKDAAAVPILVEFSGGGLFPFAGSLGVFDVSTGTETFLVDSSSFSITVQDFGTGGGGINVGGLAFQFTSFSSGDLIDTAPFDSVAYLESVAGNPFGPLGTGYRARLQEGNTLQLSYQILGVAGSQSSLVTFSFTAIPEPSAASLVGLGAGLLAWRRGRLRA